MAPPSTTPLTSKIKVQLKLSISRLRMIQQKDSAIAKQQRRAMASLLEQGKIESARIRVENIIRSDLTSELHEILELYCELLLARSGLLDNAGGGNGKELDPGLEEAVKSLIYAAPRTDVKELQQVRVLLVEKFGGGGNKGKEYALEVGENRDGKVSGRVLAKLKVEPPEERLVQGYLEEIARTYGVQWPKRKKKEEEEEEEEEGGGREGNDDDDDNDDDDEQPGSGGRQLQKTIKKKKNLEPELTTDELSRATPPRNDLGPTSPLRIAPPSPSTENLSPRVKLPGPPELKPGAKMVGMGTGGKVNKKQTTATRGQGDAKNKDKAKEGGEGGGGGTEQGQSSSSTKGTTTAPPPPSSTVVVGGKIPDVDDLQKRFAELKRRG